MDNSDNKFNRQGGNDDNCMKNNCSKSSNHRENRHDEESNNLSNQQFPLVSSNNNEIDSSGEASSANRGFSSPENSRYREFTEKQIARYCG